MFINTADSTNFQKLYMGYSIKENIIKKNDKKLLSEVNKIAKSIRKQNLHKAKNVDIVLQHDEDFGYFYGVISSKKSGTPNHPQYSHKVSADKPLLENFANWVQAWDKLYAKK